MTAWIETTKNTDTYTTDGQSSYSATAGQYKGFGAFNYAGGEVLITNNTVYTTPTKN